MFRYKDTFLEILVIDPTTDRRIRAVDVLNYASKNCFPAQLGGNDRTRPRVGRSGKTIAVALIGGYSDRLHLTLFEVCVSSPVLRAEQSFRQ